MMISEEDEPQHYLRAINLNRYHKSVTDPFDYCMKIKQEKNGWKILQQFRVVFFYKSSLVNIFIFFLITIVVYPHEVFIQISS